MSYFQIIVFVGIFMSFTLSSTNGNNYSNRNEEEIITVVSGNWAMLSCPIKTLSSSSEFKWEKAGERLPIDHRHQIHSNGTLIIANVRKKADDGIYICYGNDFKGNIKRRHLTLRVIDGPKIAAFELPSDLQVGMKLRTMCSVLQGDQPLRFTWLKDGHQINAESGLKIQNYKDYSMLTTDNIQLAHAGNITCTVSNEASQSSYSSILKVNAPPWWTIEPKDTQVVLGSRALIDCSASGSPQPYITWKRATGTESWDFIHIYNSPHYTMHSNGSLEVHETNRQEAGFYVCQASNGIVPDIGKVIQLTVNEPPNFHVKMKSESIKKGDSAELECTCTGDSPIEINWWLKDERTMIKDEKGRYMIRHTEDRQMKIASSTLTIENVKRNHSSYYICKAANKYGIDEAVIHLVIQESPGTPQEIRLFNVTESSIILGWKEPFRGNSVIISYLIQYKLDYENSSVMELLVNGTQRSTVINNLKPNTRYLIRIAAQNKIGWSESSDWIKVKTDESAPAGPPVDVTASPTGPNSIKITWKSPLKDLWNGQINGYYVGYRAASTDQDNNMYKTVEALDEANRYESHLTNLQRSTVYIAWVQAYNVKGAGPRSDEVSVTTLADVPPSAPILKVHSTTTNSITLSWSMITSFSNSVNQFTLYQRTYTNHHNFEPWKETSFSTSEMRYTVIGLECGQSYEFYMTAHNSVGKSEPSGTLVARTDGAPPLSPQLHDIMASIGMEEAIVNLEAWRGGGCPITHFSIKIRNKNARNWNIITSHYSSNQNYIIRNLIPNTHYELEINAHSPAGSTQAQYELTTKNYTNKETTFRIGHKASSPYPMQSSKSILEDYQIVLPIVVSTFVVIVLIVVSFCLCSRDSSFLNNGRNRQADCSSNSKVPFQIVSMKDLSSTSRVIQEGPSECDVLASAYGHSECNVSGCIASGNPMACNSTQSDMHTTNTHQYALPYDILPVPQPNHQQNHLVNTLSNQKLCHEKCSNNIYASTKNVLQMDSAGPTITNFEVLVPVVLSNEII